MTKHDYPLCNLCGRTAECLVLFYDNKNDKTYATTRCPECVKKPEPQLNNKVPYNNLPLWYGSYALPELRVDMDSPAMVTRAELRTHFPNVIFLRNPFERQDCLKNNNKKAEVLDDEDKTIYIDSRERNKDVQHLFDWQSDFPIEIKKLELGDIIFDGCLIERKTFNDFAQSIRKEDFWNKLYRAKEVYSNGVFIWIDTNEYEKLKELKYSRNPKLLLNSIIGAKAALDANGIIWREFDKAEASEYFYTYFKRLIDTHNYTPKPVVKKKNKSWTELRVQTLMSVPGIGYNTAVKLLSSHKTIENIIELSKNSKSKIMENIKKIFIGDG